MAAACAVGDSSRLILVSVLLLIMALSLSDIAWAHWRRSLYRLRWLFLSLAILFFWFTPGEPLFTLTLAQTIVPTWEGVKLGTQRVIALVLMVTGAHLLLQCTSRSQLLQAIYVLSWPLLCVPGLRERFAVRLALTMEHVTRVQDLVLEARSEATSGGIRRQERWGRLVREVLQRTLSLADDVGAPILIVSDDVRPPMWQWIMLLAVAALLIVA